MAFISLNSCPSPELWLQQEPETMSPKPQPTGRCPHLLDSVIEQRSACLCLLNAGIEGVHHHTCGYFQFIGLPVVFGVIWLKIMHTDILITGETGPVSSTPLRLAASSSGRDIFILCASSLHRAGWWSWRADFRQTVYLFAVYCNRAGLTLEAILCCVQNVHGTVPHF